MSLASLVRDMERQAAAPEVPEPLYRLAFKALFDGWTWTRSSRHAVRAADLYLAVRNAGVPGGQAVAATKAAVAALGGWFVVRGNLRHVRGVRLNHMGEVEAWRASRHLRKSWRSRRTEDTT